jgi:hypothetical protein
MENAEWVGRHFDQYEPKEQHGPVSEVKMSIESIKTYRDLMNPCF